MHKPTKQKLIVILGPTAVGKTALSISLAHKYSGEIVSADSRQVYRGLDIGTEKVTGREMCGVKHHLLSIRSPKRTLSVVQYKEEAEKVIAAIYKRGNIPFLVGGTGFYIDAVVYNRVFPAVPPNTTLRKKLSKKTPAELMHTLEKLDPDRAQTIEQKNRRRLIRAIEIAKHLGRVPTFETSYTAQGAYETLLVGLTLSDTPLRKRIDKRLMQAWRKGLVAETKKLRESGVSWKRINELGLEYRTAGQYIRGDISRAEAIVKMQREIWQYAKRQKRWFKRNKNIKWFAPQETKKIEEAVERFLSNEQAETG